MAGRGRSRGRGWSGRLPMRDTASRTSKEKNKLFVKANAAWDRGDLSRAFELFSCAAEAGDVSCQLDLGYFFDRGLHVKKDNKKAMHWYYQAYRQGDAGAANNIATLHRECGRTGRMIWWFRRAVAMGDHDALLELGKCYEAGIGLPKSPRQATLCYHRVLASDQVTQLSQERAKRRLSRLKRHEHDAG
jgi:TPR repeat protein